MSFDVDTKMRAFRRAGGRCECRSNRCEHVGRCPKTCESFSLINELRFANGETPSFPGFEFHHIVAESKGGPSTLENCAFLCEECHEMTRNYGRS
ncbi:HNH endonuclease [Candidatus Saccharibacteria bacterium]|nr:HNH endonuclease [Candidatus Saccharibacteria bacterium]